MTRSFGALPDPEDPRDRPVSAILTTTSIPSTISHDWAVGVIRDQTWTNTCTGQASCKSASTWARIRGIPCDELSALSPYWLGRMLGELRAGVALSDSGSFPRDVSRAMQRYGYVPEAAWPFIEANVNRDVPWSALSEACAHRLDAFYRINSTGGDRSEDVRRALSEGHIITLTLDVDRAFMEHAGSSEVGPESGLSRGLHRVCSTGYRPGAIRILNSWGYGWADNGFCWLSDARLEDARTRDIECSTLISL